MKVIVRPRYRPYGSGFYLFLREWELSIVSKIEKVLFVQMKIDSTSPSNEGMYSLGEYIHFLQQGDGSDHFGSDPRDGDPQRA